MREEGIGGGFGERECANRGELIIQRTFGPQGNVRAMIQRPLVKEGQWVVPMHVCSCGVIDVDFVACFLVPADWVPSPYKEST